MIHFLWNLIGAVAAFVLILAALVYIVSPKHGGEMLRRLGIFLVGALVGLCLLREFAVCVGPLSLLLAGLVVIVVSYVALEARRGHHQRTDHRRGAERTPVLPQPDEERQ